MAKVSREDILDQMQWRYAVKKFDPTRKVSEEDWRAMEEVLRLAPSSYGLQPWKFIIVRDPGLRASLRKASWNQSQTTDASHFVVFLYHRAVDEAWVRKNMDITETVRGLPKGTLDKYHDLVCGDVVRGPRAKTIDAWAQRQTYIAMGMLMETAALLAIDTCPMEGLDPAEYDRILGLETGEWGTVAACAVGYRAADDKLQHAKKVRFTREEIFEDR